MWIRRSSTSVVPLIARHEGLGTAVAHGFDEIPWAEFWVFQVWLFGALFLYCLIWQLVRVAGADNVQRMLWSPTAEAREG